MSYRAILTPAAVSLLVIAHLGAAEEKQEKGKLPGFPKISCNDDYFEVKDPDDKSLQLLTIKKREYSEKDRQITWLLEINVENTLPRYSAILSMWGTYGPKVMFFDSDGTPLTTLKGKPITIELKKKGSFSVVEAKKGDAIKVILDLPDEEEFNREFPKATKVRIQK